MRRFDKDLYAQWVAGVDEACSFNLAQPLIVRNDESNFISVNFDPQVTAISLFLTVLPTLWLILVMSSCSWSYYLVLV